MPKAAALVFGSVLCSVAPFFMAGVIITRFWSGAAPDIVFLAAMSAGVLLCMVLKNVLLGEGLAASHRLAYRTLAGLRKKTADKLLRVSLGDIEKYGAGNAKKNFVENIEEMELILAHHIPEGIGNILSALVVLLVMFIVDWRLALCAVGSIVIGFLPCALMFADSMKRMVPWYESSARMNNTIIEYIGGMEVIRVFGQTTRSFKKYRDSVIDYRDKTLDWYRMSWNYMASYAVLLPAALLYVVPAGVLCFAGGTLAIGDFVISLLLALSLGTPLVRFISFFGAFPQLKYKAQIIESAFALPDMPEGTKPAPPSADVCYENVSFAYNEQDVINHVSLSAKPGTITALVGESGSGKSTLARLLVRFWDVREGAIKIGGVDVREMSFAALMDQVSFVSQENFLFNASIRENIRYGRPTASDDEVIAMATLAQCHEFITQTEDGYDTMAGGSGDKLSGGERQRICIARAMLKNAPIVVLDEATSFTDPENEDKIQEALSGLIAGKTVIIIAHRLSTIVDADNIVLLENGRIADQGRHGELLSRNALYQKLWDAHVETLDWNIATNIAPDSAQEGGKA
jgi:ATP-binding cassette subfamily B protein